eukprot:TRINITY_DN804_c0_g2_i3.p1 TRINITY_DN804_c0_g2~~TRINITY_DN804_c0_g2_i3.p1  ORF type:complete len:125 (-),score=21.68 TRINITY_DN804_c0_g2_i3:76-411(-)
MEAVVSTQSTGSMSYSHNQACDPSTVQGVQQHGVPGAYGGMPGGMPVAYGGMPGAMPGAYGGMPGAMPGAYGGMPGGMHGGGPYQQYTGSGSHCGTPGYEPHVKSKGNAQF